MRRRFRNRKRLQLSRQRTPLTKDRPRTFFQSGARFVSFINFTDHRLALHTASAGAPLAPVSNFNLICYIFELQSVNESLIYPSNILGFECSQLVERVTYQVNPDVNPEVSASSNMDG